MPAYLDNYVRTEEVERLYSLMDTEQGYEARYWRWKSYASALRWHSAQQIWFHQILGSNETSPICSCGLVFIDDDELLEMAYPEINLEIEPYLMVRAHRNLPSQDGIATALIVDVLHAEDRSKSLATAYCQHCAKVVHGVMIHDAQLFVEEHNRSCQR